MFSIYRHRAWLFLMILLVLFSGIPSGYASAGTSSSNPSNQNDLQQFFSKAAKEFGVPLSILMSVSYNETRWIDHNGHPSTSGGYGVMHLTEVKPEINAKGDEVKGTKSPPIADPGMDRLDEAAKLLGAKPEALKNDIEQNIRGGAALLAKYARDTIGHTSNNPADWYGAVAKYSGSHEKTVAEDFADQVFATIREGAHETLSNGQHIVLQPEKVKAKKDTARSLHLKPTKPTGIDCPKRLDCQFIPAAYERFSSSPADYGNYDLARRPNDGLDIRYIIIHDVEGSYASAINIFQSKSYVSAHYVIRSSDGQVTEMVKPEHVAWQAGNWYVNSHSIGIEHEGYAVEGATWYSEPMYHASAKLVKYLAATYNIPLDRAHILGHDNVPGLTPASQTRMHWDPAAYWNWEHFFKKLGAPIHHNGHKDSPIVMIAPDYRKNKPPLTYGEKQLETQSANFVYLYSAPSFDAPLVSDPALHKDGEPGTTAINDWGDKASTGQRFYRADQKGDWTAIYYGGKKVWFYNPKEKNTVRGEGILITPKKGLDAIPVYGAAYPESTAYDGTGIPAEAGGKVVPLQYTMKAGQVYVATNPVQSDYYYAKRYNDLEGNKVVSGHDEYYQIFFNHRIAFVKKSDVELVKRSVKPVH
ncbi:N-acetylmuramoyl-L-alanine amidase [Fictibacillus gelatini]|uniref:N-acetylmuramoyl-L-alanine amidase n=1 Tax=Fictibacillus gelatini TaxID=225985 RepID=UPI0004288F84|nr:N-acetylmuramoyl-L-alanine amidase [Fictibacillus gelatini]